MPAAEKPYSIMISIVIPAYNEAHRILPSLRSLSTFCSTHFSSYEILLVDDGSTDDTIDLAGGMKHVQILRLPANHGKGFAVKHGMTHAQGRFCFFTDADLPYDLNAFQPAIDEFEKDNCDMITGARNLSNNISGLKIGGLRRMAGLVFSNLASRMTGINIRDTQCGFKGFTAPTAKTIFSRLKTMGYTFDVEIFALARAMNLKVSSVPVKLVKNKGSKIRLNRDPFFMLIDLIKISHRIRSGEFEELSHFKK